ncbi:MAG: hypothetical protein ACOCQ4_02295 [bacterium]
MKNTQEIDISKYKEDHSFYPEIKLLITIKSFDLQAIRERYLKNKNKKSNRTGSVNRREVALGGVAEITIKNGKIVESNILNKFPEPRGVDSFKEVTAFSSENKVYLLRGESLQKISNPWFSYIHTIDIEREDSNRMLVSSSGFDCIFEYSIEETKKTFEWFAWENGFNHGIDPETSEKLFLTRKKEEAEKYQANGKKHLFISDPENQMLPTAKRAAFINSVVYDPFDKGNVIATFFHEGAVYQINRYTGKATKVLDDLNNPHGGMKLSENEYMGTSTRGGEIVIGNRDNQTCYSFKHLGGKPEFLREMEWVQNTKIVDNNFIAIDSNRNAFVIFDPAKNMISRVEYDPNWAIQDLVVSYLDEEQKNTIRNIKQY